MRTLSLLALVALSCLSQNDPNRYGTVAVYLSPPSDVDGFASGYLPALRAALPLASRFGPTFVETTDRAHADVLVLHWDSMDGAGYWDRANRVARINLVNASGALTTVLTHELGHAVGMTHVCRETTDVTPPDTCSPVGLGRAVMNPGARYGALRMPDGSEAFGGDDITQDPTFLDLAEFRRVHR